MNFDTLPEAWNTLVPEFKCATYIPLHFHVKHWDSTFGQQIGQINPKRADKRWASYVNPEELDRVRGRLDNCSLRFGVEKIGRGYTDKRGDFCLVGAVIQRRHLTVFYRSLELVGGFGYDLNLFTRLEDALGLHWKSLSIYACQGWVFAPQCNQSHTKEKLFNHMKRILQ